MPYISADIHIDKDDDLIVSSECDNEGQYFVIDYGDHEVVIYIPIDKAEELLGKLKDTLKYGNCPVMDDKEGT